MLCRPLVLWESFLGPSPGCSGHGQQEPARSRTTGQPSLSRTHQRGRQTGPLSSPTAPFLTPLASSRGRAVTRPLEEAAVICQTLYGGKSRQNLHCPPSTSSHAGHGLGHAGPACRLCLECSGTMASHVGTDITQMVWRKPLRPGFGAADYQRGPRLLPGVPGHQ